MKKKIAILIVNYNGSKFLSRCLDAVRTSQNPNVEYRIYVVENKSTDDSLVYLQQQKDIILLEQEKNLGFAGGNNVGYRYITREGWADYLFLLNQDAYCTDGCLDMLAQFLERHTEAVAVQPLICLYPATNTINSTGNRIHYLGFGYSADNEQPVTIAPTESKEINYASGAAVMIRLQAVQTVGGLYDDFMFMYLEDLDFGWRTTLAGYKNYLLPTAKVFHQYEFHRSIRQVYYFERNRLWIYFKNYRFATLLLLAPAFIVMEIGQLFFAVLRGWFGAKLRGYLWLLRPQSMVQLWRDRVNVQRMRRVSDRQMLSSFSGRIEFQPLDSWGLRIANLFLGWYHRCILFIIRW